MKLEEEEDDRSKKNKQRYTPLQAPGHKRIPFLSTTYI